LARLAVVSAAVFASGTVQAQSQVIAPTTPAAPAAAPAAAPLPPPVPFDQALLLAANNLFSKVELADGTPAPATLVIDPLIDGMTGIQSNTTRAMERRMVELVKSTYPKFKVEPFTTATVAKSPVVLVGTFTPISLAGKVDGPRDAFRVCLALLDLKSGKIVSKGFARATPAGIEHAPVAYFNDSPVWTNDPAIQAYIKSCQGTKAGDAISQAYADRVLAAAFLSDAINAYNDKRYGEALELYRTVLRTPGGDQLRTYNGLYLASQKLNRKAEAASAFSKVVEHGLANNRLAVKFLFKPGSMQFWSDKKTATPYSMWLKTIAQKTASSQTCLEIVGHSSPTGPEPINLRLSGLRAEYVKDRLQTDAPTMAKRMIASGMGSKEPMVGTGKDNASDALDRRVEFKTIPNCT
jgi:outer membrane protein OmpA-like peptidoglycan-associated protein